MNITISPGRTRGRYDARLDDGRIFENLETPFYSTARRLKAAGTRPDEPLTMTHEGSDTVCLRSTVGEAAALSVKDHDVRGLQTRAYQPSPFARTL